ncbi:hypothetical protein LMG24235_06150 [Paraburkholderia sabiae]|nr:hypothetical protein LMG24235_06150 [Paraburkholderia sabiae]
MQCSTSVVFRRLWATIVSDRIFVIKQGLASAGCGAIFTT